MSKKNAAALGAFGTASYVAWEPARSFFGVWLGSDAATWATFGVCFVLGAAVLTIFDQVR